MSQEDNDNKVELPEAEEEQENEQTNLVLSDDLIAVIRELVQLTLITGTNIVDHFRAIRCEVDEKTNKVIPTEQYIESYNHMVQQLEEQAERAAAELAGEATAEKVTAEDLVAGSFSFNVVKDDKDLN